MVELWINDSYIDLEEDQKIALYYQLSKLGDLENRKANMTSSITAPHTKNNCITFGYLNVPESASELPYVKMSAKMKIEGLEVIRSGYAIIDDITKKGFELNVYWGNYDLFSILKERKLSDLDLVSYDDIWDSPTKLTYTTKTSGLVYPLIDWHKDSPNSAILETGNSITSAFIYPCFYLHTLFNEIITQAGFTYEIFYDKSSDFLNKMIPLITRKSDTNLNNDCHVDYHVHLQQFLQYKCENNKLQQMYPLIGVIDDFGLVNTTMLSPNRSYLIPADGTYSFTANFNLFYDEDQGGIVYATLGSSKGHLHQVAPGALFPGDDNPHQYQLALTDIYLNKGDYVYWGILNYNIADKFIDQYPGINEFKCTKSILKQTEENVNYPIAVNLPDMTQADLVKYVMQRYGLFCNNIDNHITFFSIDTIIDNKGKAVSLDDKIVSDIRMFEGKKPSIDGFGQKNIWEYAKDEEINSGYVECNNTNLEKEQKIYTAPFTECSDSIRLGGVKMANIKRLEQKGTPLASWWKYDVKPKILSSYLLTKNFTWYVSGGGSSAITSIIVGVFDDYVNVDSCDMQKTLDENYTELANILTNPSEIKVFVNWNIQDFININPMYPYYLWNSFYILNSVDGFVEGELTKLDLIRI